MITVGDGAIRLSQPHTRLEDWVVFRTIVGTLWLNELADARIRIE